MGQSRHFGVGRQLPVYPNKPTKSRPVGMSQRCQCKSLRPSPPTYDPHSTRCTAGCHTPADFVHCAFRTPAAAARGSLLMQASENYTEKQTLRARPKAGVFDAPRVAKHERRKSSHRGDAQAAKVEANIKPIRSRADFLRGVKWFPGRIPSAN